MSSAKSSPDPRLVLAIVAAVRSGEAAFAAARRHPHDPGRAYVAALAAVLQSRMLSCPNGFCIEEGAWRPQPDPLFSYLH